MAPELIPLAAPVPLPSLFEWVKVIAPPIITGAVVLLGIRKTYDYANKGRKEDILYKERYKNFEAISIYAHSMENLIYEISEEVRLIVLIPKRQNADYMSNAFSNLLEDSYKLIESTPNVSSIILFREDTKVSFYGLITSHPALNSLLYKYSLSENYVNDSNYLDIDKMSAVFMGMIKQITQYKERVIELALRDLDLPKR